MDYVKFYKQELGISFSGKKYDIHHIDQNRDNNSLDNLLLLPKRLHHQYHYGLGRDKSSLFDWDPVSAIHGNRSNYYILFELDKLLEIYNECCIWADYKEYLLGNMPNVHGIEL